ncbi:MAG: lipopolysaccharide biosynthesis protein [Fimbriimonadales bacterium]|nr:lipopolysaccharide biosynthesis protein [Fimbriimonadales bacterium]
MRESRNSFARSVFWLAAGTAVAQGLFVLASPLLSRLYTPQQFGEFAAFMATASLLLPLATLRYEAAIPLPEDNRDAAALVLLCLILSCICGCLFSLLLLVPIMMSRVHSLLGLSTSIWLWIPVSLVLISAYQTMSFWATRQKEYQRLSQTRIYQGVVGTAAMFGLGWLNLGTVGLITGEIVARSAGAATLARSILSSIAPFKLPHLKEQAKRYRRFAFIGLPDALLGAAVLHMSPLLILTLFGGTEAGWFGVVNRLISAPVGLVGYAAAQAFLGHAAATYRQGESMADLTFDTLRWLASRFLVPFIVFGMILIPIGILTLYAPQWHAAAWLAIPVCLGQLGGLIVSPLSHLLNILHKQHILLLWNLGRVLGMLMIWGSVIYAQLTLSATVWAIALLHTAAYLLLLGIILKHASSDASGRE